MGNLGNSGILVWSPHLRDPNLPWTEPEQIIQCSYNSLSNILYDMLSKKGSEFPINQQKRTLETIKYLPRPPNNKKGQQKHIKITANPNVPTLLVWLRCLFTLRQGWIGLWIGKIRMGSDCFEFSDFRRKPFWAGAWWKYECGNGPFPQISFYSQTLRFVKSDKNKFLITPRAWQYINSTSCERMLEHRFSSSLCWMML